RYRTGDAVRRDQPGPAGASVPPAGVGPRGAGTPAHRTGTAASGTGCHRRAARLTRPLTAPSRPAPSPTTRRTSMPEGSPPTRTVFEPARTTVHVQRRTMIVLVLMQVVGTVGVGVAPSIGVLLAGEVTDSEAWAGLARTSSTLGAALLGLPLGNLAARAGRRTALATGWWTAAAGSALLVAAAQGDLIVALFVGLLLIGAGSAVSLQARFAATDLATPVRKGRSLALIVWVGTRARVLCPRLAAPGRLLGPSTG